MEWNDEDVWGWNFSYGPSSRQDQYTREISYKTVQVCSACQGEHNLDDCPQVQSIMGDPHITGNSQSFDNNPRILNYTNPTWINFQPPAYQREVSMPHPLEVLMAELDENSKMIEESVSEMRRQRIYDELEQVSKNFRAMCPGTQLTNSEINSDFQEEVSGGFEDLIRHEHCWKNLSISADAAASDFNAAASEAVSEQIFAAPISAPIQVIQTQKEESRSVFDTQVEKTLREALRFYDEDEKRVQEESYWIEETPVMEGFEKVAESEEFSPYADSDDEFFMEEVVRDFGASDSKDEINVTTLFEKTPTSEEVLVDLHLDSLFEEESIPPSIEESVHPPKEEEEFQEPEINTFKEFQDPFVVWEVNPKSLLKGALKLLHYTTNKSFIKRMVRMGYEEIKACLKQLLVSYSWDEGKPLILKPP